MRYPIFILSLLFCILPAAGAEPEQSKSETTAEPAAEQAKPEPTAEELLYAGVDAYESGDLKLAAEYFRKSAEAGCSDAYVNLAILDKKNAVFYLQKAEDMGNTFAMMNLGNYCLQEKQYKDAAEHFQKALNKGERGAATMLGRIYHAGLGVEKDTRKAVVYFEIDALRKVPEAMNLLGVMLFTGRGIPQDQTKGQKLFSEAAELNYAPAINNLGMIALYANAKDSAKHAEKHFLRAAGMNYAPAKCNLALLRFADGRTEEAGELAKSAAEQGAAAGYYIQGMIALLHEKDPGKAFPLYLRSAELGYLYGMIQAVKMYQEGNGTPQDMQAADRWLARIRNTETSADELPDPAEAEKKP